MLKKTLRNIFLPDRKKNLVADTKVLPVSTVSIVESGIIDCIDFNVDEEELVRWATQYFPDGKSAFGTYLHKKILELFISWKMLDPQPSDVFMDAAGGQFSYISQLDCREKIIQDLFITDKLKSIHRDKVQYIESSCSSIPLKDGSVNKISCHHSIEHFQGDADVQFTREVQRLLAPGGKCVILPVFLSGSHFRITDSTSFTFWDEVGETLTDESATLPGGKGSGNFSRVYSLSTFKERILNAIDRSRFHVTLHPVKMNGREIPDAQHFFNSDQAKINLSYRALLIGRK